MIKNHSIEEATPEGVKSGKFIFNKSAARAGSAEILKTHLGLEGQKADEYMDQYFDKTWKHFDTAGDGKIEADRMPGFYRFLCGNQ